MCEAQTESVKYAVCRMAQTSGKQPIWGAIYLTQKISPFGNGTSEGTKIDVALQGFVRAGTETLKGFHVHDSGNLDNACGAAGGHYNPFNKTHGGPTDAVRHVGDLGNIKVSVDGTVRQTIFDQQVSLVGPYSVLNRAFVVHEDQDDLGKGSFSDSMITGHAGARLGCCVIMETNKDETPPASRASTNHSSACSAIVRYLSSILRGKIKIIIT